MAWDIGAFEFVSTAATASTSDSVTTTDNAAVLVTPVLASTADSITTTDSAVAAVLTYSKAPMSQAISAPGRADDIRGEVQRLRFPRRVGADADQPTAADE